MFRVMEQGWDADLGSPGPMVHGIETLEVSAYAAPLIESVRRRPMYLNLWMVNRILNVTQDTEERLVWMNLLREVCKSSERADGSQIAAGFLKHQGGATTGANH